MSIILFYLKLFQPWPALLIIFVLQIISPVKLKSCIQLSWVVELIFVFTISSLLISLFNSSFQNYLFFHPVICLYSYCPDYLCYIMILFVISFITYWTHRFSHKLKYIWEYVHKFHHKQTTMNVFSSAFLHPLEVVFNSSVSVYCCMGLFGMGVEQTFVILYIIAVLAYFQHSNIKTPYWLGYYLVRPEMHKRHHEFLHHKNNYSLLPIWDIIFNTFENPQQSPQYFGFSQPVERYRPSMGVVALRDWLFSLI